MTIEQRKLALIDWINDLQDEIVIDQIEQVRKASLDELPPAIVELLKIAISEKDEDCIPHTSVQDILDMDEE